MFSQIKDRKNIVHNFHSVAGAMPQARDLGVLGSKILAWGFVMAPHRLRVLVTPATVAATQKRSYAHFDVHVA